MGRPKGPPTGTKSIRLPVAEWERLEIEAKAAGLNLNGHVARLLGVGRANEADSPAEETAKPKPKALSREPDLTPEPLRSIVAGLSVPVGTTRGPMQKSGRK